MITIEEFYQKNELNEDFGFVYYKKTFPETKNFYQPYCFQNNISEKQRLYFHYCLYCPQDKKSLFLSNEKILVKIPTKNRPEALVDCINSFYKNHSGCGRINFLISANICDKKTKKFEESINALPDTKIIFANYQNKVEAYNDGLDQLDFDILILASDDMIAVEDCYDRIIVNNMIKFFPNKDGVLWFDTGDGNTRTNTIPIVSKNFYEKNKPIYKNQYKGYFCDDEFCQTAFKLGKMVRINQCIIKHNIPNHLEMSEDSTYLKSLKYAIEDKANYKIRKKIQFDTPGIEETPNFHNIPLSFVDHKRNQGWGNSWNIPDPRYDDPISVMDLYVLEKKDKEVANMNLEDFLSFSKNYFRNFRWTIPHIIHQIWIGKPAPKKIKEMMETFSVDYVKKHPYCRYILWDEEKLNDLDMINHDIFEKEKSNDCKSDIARLEILNKFGGIYVDADTIWLGNKSILSLQNQISHGILIAYEKDGEKIGSGYLKADTKRCANGVLGATIQNPIIAYFIGQTRKSYLENRKYGVVASTGPDFFQSTIESLRPEIDINILNHKYFYPCWWCNRREDNIQYDEFIESQKTSIENLSKKHSDSILFHLGFTSKEELK